MIQNCVPPKISIKDYSPNHIRSKSITFSINAELACNRWTTTDIKCEVIACFPGDLSCTNTSKLDIIVNSFVSKIADHSFEMNIPPFGLPVGKYNFSCIIRMSLVPTHNSTFNYSLNITRSRTVVTLLPLGKSKITLGYQQQYTFRPKVSFNDVDEQVD